MISHQKSDFQKHFGLDFFFHDCVIFAFGPGSNIVCEDFFRWFIVSDFEPDPWTASFLEPYLVNVFFEVFTSLREWLPFF